MSDEYEQIFAEMQRGVVSPQKLEAMMSHGLTKAQFDAIFSGETYTKPRIIHDPQSNQFYRLTDARTYELFEVANTPIKLMELDTKGLEKYRTGAKKDRPVIKGHHVENISLYDEPGHTRITSQLLFALMTAIGRDSGWWPFEDASAQFFRHFNDPDVEIRFLCRDADNFPVGIMIWDEREPKERVTINFFGLLPSERGKGIGGKFFDTGILEILAHSRNLEIQQIKLLTTDSDRLAPRPGEETAPAAINVYENRGFNTIKTHRPALPTEPVDVGGFEEQARVFLGVKPSFFRDGEGNLLAKYRDEALIARIEREWSALQSEKR